MGHKWNLYKCISIVYLLQCIGNNSQLYLLLLSNPDALNKRQGYFYCSEESSPNIIPYIMCNLEASLNIC